MLKIQIYREPFEAHSDNFLIVIYVSLTLNSSILLKGVIYMLIAAFAFAWMNLLAKYLDDFHPLQVVFFRCIGTFVFIFPFMVAKKIPILGTNTF